MATKPKTRYTYADLQRFPEDRLRRVGVAIVDCRGIVGEPLREVPLGPVDVVQRVAGQHLRIPLDGRQRAGAVPAVQAAGHRLGGDSGAVVRFDREHELRRGNARPISELGEIGDRDGRLQRGRQQS